MDLRIRHVTQYRYDAPLSYGLQRLKLRPPSDGVQTVHDWALTIDGGEIQFGYADQFGNSVDLLRLSAGAQEITIEAAGSVSIADTAGVTGPHAGRVPLWVFAAATPLTQPGPAVRALARGVRGQGGGLLDRLHALNAEIARAVSYETGRTDSTTTAEAALAAGHGVCQDHAHVMIAAARQMGLPARYVSGYLMMTDRTAQEASHAWAEVHVEDLGWVGFDPANGISPDARYLRLAVGRDYLDAAPARGIRTSAGGEALDVALEVHQQAVQ